MGGVYCEVSWEAVQVLVENKSRLSRLEIEELEEEVARQGTERILACLRSAVEHAEYIGTNCSDGVDWIETTGLKALLVETEAKVNKIINN